MKTLIINLGPPGDVLRTTVLLSELKAEIFWLTKEKCKDVLNSDKIFKKFFFESQEDIKSIKEINWDIVISLNEELEALNIVRELKTNRLIGVFIDSQGKIDYTEDSKYWFNMSLSSKLGKQEADTLKFLNKKSYPQILIEMIGKKWHEQEYDLNMEVKIGKGIGLIKETTGLWKNKGWAYYDNLKKILEKDGYCVRFLDLRPSIKDHIEDINNCELIICGDTLGLHISLALKKKTIALFNCTSPNEIFGYHRLTKIVSSELKKYFYQKEFSQEAISAITLNEVYSAVKKVLKT